MQNTISFHERFYKENSCSPPSLLLLSQSDSFYFAKDQGGVFVCVDQALLNHFGMSSSSEIIGKTDFHIQRRDLAEKHRADDLSIIKSGKCVPSKLELVGDGNGNVKWFQTTKSPLRNSRGQVVGIEGLSRDVKLIKESIQPYTEFKKTIAYLQKNFKDPIHINKLAQNNAMALCTFERKFKRHFNCSPIQFIKKLRIDHACSLLCLNYNISEIALECGFCDQSYFTKEFKKYMHITPRQFKLKHAQDS